MCSSPIWRLAPGQRLVHRCHDGECVLFNDLTGDTHLLDPFTIALLDALRATPQPAASLAALCAEHDGGPTSDPADPAELEACEELLADLAALNLIEALPC